MSRVGIVDEKKGLHLSQVILNFFDFYLFEMESNILIYTKVRKGKDRFLGPSYRVIASNWDDHWGDYVFLIRSLKKVI